MSNKRGSCVLDNYNFQPIQKEKRLCDLTIFKTIENESINDGVNKNHIQNHFKSKDKAKVFSLYSHNNSATKTKLNFEILKKKERNINGVKLKKSTNEQLVKLDKDSIDFIMQNEQDKERSIINKAIKIKGNKLILPSFITFNVRITS